MARRASEARRVGDHHGGKVEEARPYVPLKCGGCALVRHPDDRKVDSDAPRALTGALLGQAPLPASSWGGAQHLRHCPHLDVYWAQDLPGKIAHAPGNSFAEG